MTLRTARPTFAQNLSTDGVRRLVASYSKSANGAIVDDFRLKPGFLYTQVRAISARVNQNYDGWPSTELKKSYRTFLGKPVFVNHQNFDPSKARGRVVAARYVESGNDKFVEVIQEIDAQRFPKLANEIRTGGLDSVSMGVEAGFTKCSVCDNKATDLHDMCSHVKYHKGEYLPHAKTGKKTLVFENCYKLGFFELSYVFDPADETAVVSKVLVANRRRHAYGEVEAPEDVDTLRNSDDSDDDHFHHYVESPKELRTPSMDNTINLDRQQEEDGLDNKRRAEDVEDLNPADGGKKIVEPDTAHEQVIDDFLDWCDSINVAPGQDSLDDFSNSYRLNNEDYQAISDFLESEGNGAGTTSNANQPVPRMSRRKMATYRYAEESQPPWLEDSEGYGEDSPETDPMQELAQLPPEVLHELVQSGQLPPEILEQLEQLMGGEGGMGDEEGFDADGDGDEDFSDDSQYEDDVDGDGDHDDDDHHYSGDDDYEDYDGDGDHDEADHHVARRRSGGNMDIPPAEYKRRGRGGWPSPSGGPYEYPGYGRADGRHQEIVEDDLGYRLPAARVDGKYTDDAGYHREWQDPHGEVVISDSPLESDYVGRHRASNGKNNTSSQKKRRAQKGNSMARETLASRGRKAASRQRLHRFADESGHFDSGPYDENNQGEQEEVFLSQTPGKEGLAAPVPGDGTISNTENTLVARINAQKNSLQRDILAWNNIQRRKYAGEHEFGVVENPVNPFSGMPEGETPSGTFGPTNGGVPKHQARRYAADGGLPDADTVNPELSGTDDQSLKGQDFERVQPDKVETQSKDASLKAFAAFDHWLRSTTGRTAAQHGNANFIRRQATRWAGTYGYPVEVLFPALGTFLRQARRIEGSSTMRRTADEKLEVAAPQDRIDVEAPVSGTTDADAQASQFDLSDFGGNASDNVADPNLDTGSQIWAPGEGVKESNRKADGVAAIRLAEAYIKAGLKPESEKYNLVAQFQTMRHATVTDRTRLLEAVLKTAAFSRRVTAGSINRGTAPRTPIPPGLMNGGGMSRSASVNRVAANDPSTDSDLFL